MKNTMKNKLLDLLNAKILECYDMVQTAYGINPHDIIERIACLDFRIDPSKWKYGYDDVLMDAIYFLKYGLAYAFEYAAIYEIVLSVYKPDVKKLFGTTSIGCGSSLDAWSLAYANAYLESTDRGYKSLDLLYQGVDQIEWGVSIDSSGSSMNPMNPFYYKYNSPFIETVNDFFSRHRIIQHYNNLFFPKILSELDDSDIDNIVDAIKSGSPFNTDREYFICISHAGSFYKKRPKLQNVAEEIAKAINAVSGGAFNVIKKVNLGRFSAETEPLLPAVSIPCYKFIEYPAPIYHKEIMEINADFNLPDVVAAQNWMDTKAVVADPNAHRCVNRASSIAFQIIKLEPK